MTQLPQHTLHNTVAGRFKLNVRKQKGDTLVRKLSFDNLITDAGLEMMNTNPGRDAGVMRCCHLGASSQQPSFSDTTLVSWLRSVEYRGSVDHEPFAAPGGAAGTRSTANYRFNPLNSGSGMTISEIGVSFRSPSTTPMFSRTLIKDEQGDTTTITILPDEYLDVEYTLTFLAANIETFSTLNIRGETIEVSIKRYTFSPGTSLIRTLNGFCYSSSRPSVRIWNGSPVFEHFPVDGSRPDTGWISLPNSSTPYSSYWMPYVPGSLERSIHIRLDPPVGNSGTGISGMTISHVGWETYTFYTGFFQIKFDPPIKKTAEDVLTLVFKFSWGRA